MNIWLGNLASFFFGIAAMGVAGLIDRIIPESIISTPILEEVVKWGVAVLIIWRFKLPASSALFVALGFGANELLQYYQEGFNVISRLYPFLLHTLTGIVLWLGLRTRKYALSFLIFNIIIHFWYNYYILLNSFL
ncbi:hypothetical protein ACFL3E_00505 [Patescibacteria group bacterium]